MRVAITGACGFLGWHLSCRLLALRGVESVRLDRQEFADPRLCAARLADVDTVVHVAGVNRGDSDEAVEAGNVRLARDLVAALEGRPVHVVYANSVQAGRDTPYGRGKRAAAEVLATAAGTLADVWLPNLFGEHGRPAYNSFVATFCHEVAAGRRPTVSDDRPIPLLHAQAAAQALIEATERQEDHQVRPAAAPRRVSEVLALLEEYHAVYGIRGEIPDVSTPFDRDLFNTYRSHLFPHRFPLRPAVHADTRGDLVEVLRSHGGKGQAFASTTVPGATRGDHYHLHKVERFAVIRGVAEIALRRLFHDEVVRFRFGEGQSGIVDMPTMWTHHLRNVGTEDVVTVFWADQLLDPERPDQYPQNVEV